MMSMPPEEKEEKINVYIERVRHIGEVRWYPVLTRLKPALAVPVQRYHQYAALHVIVALEPHLRQTDVRFPAKVLTADAVLKNGGDSLALAQTDCKSGQWSPILHIAEDFGAGKTGDHHLGKWRVDTDRSITLQDPYFADLHRVDRADMLEPFDA